jgi:hypothetical protein
MTKAIQQSVRFKASPETLFDTYLDSKKHSAATGGNARMSRKAGGSFVARNGQSSGTEPADRSQEDDHADVAYDELEKIRS